MIDEDALSRAIAYAIHEDYNVVALHPEVYEIDIKELESYMMGLILAQQDKLFYVCEDEENGLLQENVPQLLGYAKMNIDLPLKDLRVILQKIVDIYHGKEVRTILEDGELNISKAMIEIDPFH